MAKTAKLLPDLIVAAVAAPLSYGQSAVSPSPAQPQAQLQAQPQPQPHPAATTISKPAAMATIAAGKPYWVELTPAQKTILAPLEAEWLSMGQLQRKKWMEIANRYSVLKPDEQARIQERMRDWVKLTPEQRMAVRENFARSTRVQAEKKSEQWQQYQQLSDEQKKELAAAAQKKKTVTNLPSEAQRTAKPIAPIKNGPKPAVSASMAHIPVPVPHPPVASPIQQPAAGSPAAGSPAAGSPAAGSIPQTAPQAAPQTTPAPVNAAPASQPAAK
jgi:hypothetical protein